MKQSLIGEAAPFPLPPRVLHWGVDLAYGALLALAPPYGLWRLATDDKTRSRWLAYARGIPERLGRRDGRHAPRRPCVWVHGVSVGEVKAATRLVERIEQSVPGVEVLISVTTDTGRRVAAGRYPNHRIEFFPPDLSILVRHALDALRPDLVILVESEFWPNFLTAARQRKIPVVLVNGRMSERSARRFSRLPEFGRALLGSLERVFVQMEVYARRFEALGVLPERVGVTGNMKFDNIPIRPDAEKVEGFRRLLGLGDQRPVLVAGSTHPGEERALAAISRRLTQDGLGHHLIVAPRHPGRRDAVEADLRREGLEPICRSALEGGGSAPGPKAAIVLDTVGELESIYAQADVVFVGGTLIPHGGQNVMEPASLGCPVLIGPYHGNFRGEVIMLARAGGLQVAENESALENGIRAWLTDPAAASRAGRAAREAIEGSKGATERTLKGLEPLLGALRSRSAPSRP